MKQLCDKSFLVLFEFLEDEVNLFDFLGVRLPLRLFESTLVFVKVLQVF